MYRVIHIGRVYFLGYFSMTQQRSVQAYYIGKNKTFRRWIDRMEGLRDYTTDERAAELFIKDQCDIKSRRELDLNPEAACAFDALLSAYRSDNDYWLLVDDADFAETGS